MKNSNELFFVFLRYVFFVPHFAGTLTKNKTEDFIIPFVGKISQKSLLFSCQNNEINVFLFSDIKFGKQKILL